MSIQFIITKFLVRLSGSKRITGLPKDRMLKQIHRRNKLNKFFIPGDRKFVYRDKKVRVDNLDGAADALSGCSADFHCLAISHKEQSKRAILCVYGGGLLLAPPRMFIGFAKKMAANTGADVWFPYYPLCHEQDILENVQMLFGCYREMLRFYAPEDIVFLGFSSGGALILDLITYLNELRDRGDKFPMPGMLIPISPGSVPVNDRERDRLRMLDRRDMMIPASFMDLAEEIMRHGHDIPQKYTATAHGDFRDAPMTHFYYGSAETLYGFAPSYAASFRRAKARCVFHIGKGVHHCYAMQYFIPGCKPAFEEVMGLILHYFERGRS